MPDFTVVALKCGPTAPKIAKISICQNGYTQWYVTPNRSLGIPP